MNSDRSHRGLRRSLDDSADKIGESVASDIPASTDEVHQQLPDEISVEALDSDGDSGDRPLETAIAESPLGDFLK